MPAPNRPLHRRAGGVVTGLAALLALVTTHASAEIRKGPDPVGVRQVEFTDERGESRTIAMVVLYPAGQPAAGAQQLRFPFYTDIAIYPDAPPAAGAMRHPLVMLSHGRGGNAWNLVWLAEFLASHGYFVAALHHYRANSYDSTIIYQANRLWQRPVDVSLGISFLLQSATWGKSIDPDRIGVAGHSQGGFTALWIGGAKVNPDLYLAFQRHWRNDPLVPDYLRRQLPLDPAPATSVADPRVKAVMAMAPGIIQAFGFDPPGLAQLRIPAFIVVGAADSQAPPTANAEYAATYIPNAQLTVLPGAVQHEIFTDECNAGGKDELPEACVDDPSVDRAKLHQTIADAALRFFDTSLHVERPH